MSSVSVNLWARQPEAQIPLSKALALFDAAYRAAGRSPRTIDWYRERLGYFFEHLTRSLDREPTLADFMPATFRTFILERMAGGKYLDHPYRTPSSDPPSSAYIHGFYRAVRGFSSWLFHERLTPANIMAELEMPKLEERELQPLTPAEEIALLESYSELKAGECRNKAIIMLMLSTGLRKAEVVALTDNRVNLEEGFITVWGKGRRQRSIPFGYKTGWVLQRYRVLLRPEPALPTIESFFLNSDGFPITAGALDMLFARTRKRTGITRLHPHLLRHTYGTRSAEHGIPTLTLQHFMGHSQPTVTARYTHIATNERIKRERSYDHLDQLEVRIRRPSRTMTSPSGPRTSPGITV